jgi:hypothetical protein
MTNNTAKELKFPGTQTIALIILGIQIFVLLLCLLIVHGQQYSKNSISRSPFLILLPLIIPLSLCTSFLYFHIKQKKLKYIPASHNRQKKILKLHLIKWISISGNSLICSTALLFTGEIIYLALNLILILFFLLQMPQRVKMESAGFVE